MKTFTIDGKEIAETLDELRSIGATDDQRAAVSVALDDVAISRGYTQEELNLLLSKVPPGSLRLVCWIAVHPKISFESDARSKT